MGKTTKVITAGFLVAIAATATIVIVKEIRKRKAFKSISEEGYEIAYDVLYPTKHFKTKRLKYGPVIPS